MADADADVSKWVHAQLTSQGVEDIPDMLINYILLMMSNNKSIPEIKTELVDLFGDEESSKFCVGLESYYKELGVGHSEAVRSAGSEPAPEAAPATAQAGAEDGEEEEAKPAKGQKGNTRAKAAKKETKHEKQSARQREERGGRNADKGRGSILDRLGPGGKAGGRDRSRSRDRNDDGRGGRGDRRGDRRDRDRDRGDRRDDRRDDRRSGRDRDQDRGSDRRGGGGEGRGGGGQPNPSDMQAMLMTQMNMMAQMSGFPTVDAMMAAQAGRGGFGGRGGRGRGVGFFPRGGGIAGGRGAGRGGRGGAGRGGSAEGGGEDVPKPVVLDKKDAQWVAPHIPEAEKAKKQAEKEATMSKEELEEDKKRMAHPMYVHPPPLIFNPIRFF